MHHRVTHNTNGGVENAGTGLHSAFGSETLATIFAFGGSFVVLDCRAYGC
jgi:hypothetical protein